MRLTASLFAKILAWFFLNMVIVAAALMVFFIFQQHFEIPGSNFPAGWHIFPY